MLSFYSYPLFVFIQQRRSYWSSNIQLPGTWSLANVLCSVTSIHHHSWRSGWHEGTVARMIICPENTSQTKTPDIHTHKHSRYMPWPYISLHICLSNRCSINMVKHIITQNNEVAHGSLRTDTSFLWKANRNHMRCIKMWHSLNDPN